VTLFFFEELGWRLVDFVVVEVRGRKSFQISVPLLDPVPGYNSPNYSTSDWGSAAPGAPSPLLTAFVLCIWAVYRIGCPQSIARDFAMMSVHHKASVSEGEGGDVTWWSRACHADREAIILFPAADAQNLMENMDRYRRPPRPKTPPLYCYIGMGVDRQPDCITGLVLRTKDVQLTAAVVVACRILGTLFPGAVPVNASSDRILAGEEEFAQAALHELTASLGSMFVPWGDVCGKKMLWDTMRHCFSRVPAAMGTPGHATPEQATPAQQAARFLELVQLDYDDALPDWGEQPEDVCPQEEEFEEEGRESSPELIFLPPSTASVVPQPPAEPAPQPKAMPRPVWRGRVGVDLGGVLLAKVRSTELGKARAAQDMRRLLQCTADSDGWLADCVANCGAGNVFVVSFVGWGKRRLFEQFLFDSGGLLQRHGIQRGNLIWTDSREAKKTPFLDKNLDLFIDDQVEVLIAIRSHCWMHRRDRPPALYLVPTAWDTKVAPNHAVQRVSADAVQANDGWRDDAWHIHAVRSVGAVRPWAG